MSQPKIKKITDLLDQLYCFTPEEIEEYKSKTPKMKKDGFDAFIKLLGDGKKEQDAFFAKLVEEDKSYPKKMSKFLATTTQKLKNQYEVEEKSGADTILEELE